MSTTYSFPPETETAIVDALTKLLVDEHPDMAVVRSDVRIRNAPAGNIHVCRNDRGETLVHASMPDGVRYFTAVVSAVSVAMTGQDPATVFACDLIWQTKPLSEGNSAVQVRMLREKDLETLVGKVEEGHLEFRCSDPAYAFRHR